MTQQPELEQTPAVAPWVAEGYGLWSLYDMIRFTARDLLQPIGAMAESATQITLRREDVDLEGVREVIALVAERLASLRLSPAVSAQLTFLQETAQDDNDSAALPALMVSFYRSLRAELEGHVFLMIPSERVVYYEITPTDDELDIAGVFGDSELAEDLAAGSRCIALDEWTAAVFHLMRALERGLRWLGTYLSVPCAATIETAQWGVVINEIDSILTKMDHGKLPRDVRWSELHDVAASLRHANTAWRQHVAHSRARYGERDALDIYRNVVRALEKLAIVKQSIDAQGVA